MKYENISILYIEDDDTSREHFFKILNELCSEVYIATGKKDALELYTSHKIDIVISALKMKKTTGIDIVKKIKAINENQLIIFTVGSSDTDLLLQAIDLNADSYIRYPIDTENVKTVVMKFIHEIQYRGSLAKLKDSEEKFQIISQISQIGIFIYKKKYVYANDAFCQAMGYSKEELYEMNVWDIIQEDSREMVKNIALRRLKGEHFPKSYSDLKLVTKSGEVQINRITTSTINYEGAYAGLGTAVDITDIKDIKERLHILAQAMEQMDEMVRITDKNGKIIYVNEAVSKYTKYRKRELIGKHNSILKSGKHTKEFYKNLWQTILSNKSYQNIFVNLKKNGETYYEDQTITPITDDDNKIKYFVSTSKDVTARIKMQEELKLLASTDGLTSIYNRYKINILIEEELSRVIRYGGLFSLIMFDIDFFKHVNDRYGHDVGDNVLIELTKIISNSIRDTDKFGRWGGEEFMILAPKLDKQDAQNLAQKLRKRVEEYDFKDVGRVTISLGVVTRNDDRDKEMLLKDVDNALYEAKNRGRNRVVTI